MRIIIIGPTLLTRNCVHALQRHGKDDIVAVYTLDDSLAWTKSRFAIMDDLPEKYSIKICKVRNINDPAVVHQIKSLSPDLILELGWSQIISGEILRIPPKGCIGVHASLLPKNRGAASLNWAIIKGEKTTGVSLFYLAERPDDGDIISQKEFPIDERDDISTLHDKSDLASVELLLENIDAIRNGTAARQKQNKEHVTYTTRRKPDDGVIDWDKKAREIYDWIRAQTKPFPGAFTYWNGMKIYVWSASATDSTSHGRRGEIINVKGKHGILVCAADNMILLTRLQAENGIEMWADDFARKYGMKEGDMLG